MEGEKRKPPYRVTCEDLVGREITLPCRCFLDVFPTPTELKESSHANLTLNKQELGQIVDRRSQTAVADGKSQGSLYNKQTTQIDDDRLLSSSEPVIDYYGSGIYYGARQYYTSSSSNQLVGTTKSKKTDHGSLVDVDVSDMLTPKGDWEWWQGSYYY